MAKPLLPDDDQRRLGRLERQASANARSTPSSQAYMDASGRVRVRVGQQLDGRWGLRVFDSGGEVGGATVYDYTTAP